MSKKKVHTENVKAKDLKVGDVIARVCRLPNGKLDFATICSIEIVPVSKRWTLNYHGNPTDCYKKKAMRRIVLRLSNGKTTLLGETNSHSDDNDVQVMPDEYFVRKCSIEAAEASEISDDILAYRVGVRTILSRCETDLVQWKNRKAHSNAKHLIAEYRKEYEKIFEKLEALDAKMTKDAGRSDKRKPVSPSGRRR